MLLCSFLWLCQANNGLKSCQSYNEMEMDRPPAIKYARVQDGKQRIYLEWPYFMPGCNVLCYNTGINAMNRTLNTDMVTISFSPDIFQPALV